MGEDDGRTVATILCATDFSETSGLAIRYGVRLARRHQAKLVLGHIVEPLPMDPYPMPMALPENDLTVQKLALERLEDLAASLRESGMRVETRLEMGPSGPQLVEMSTRLGADLILVGTRGLTGFKHLIFGSTAEYIVRRARCPVLTVHPDDREPLDSLAEVILPTDLSLDANAAAEVLQALYSDVAPPRVVLAFADSTPPYLEAFEQERLEHPDPPDVRRVDLEARMGPMAERLRAKGFQVETRILDGGAVEAITDLARQRGSDLIVMSTHGHSALVNALLGRTAQRIVQHAECPVLTVRPASRH